MCRCSTRGHGSVVDLAMLGLQLDSIILKVFSNLYVSMILYTQLYENICTHHCLAHVVCNMNTSFVEL